VVEQLGGSGITKNAIANHDSATIDADQNRNLLARIGRRSVLWHVTSLLWKSQLAVSNVPLVSVETTRN
jgi:hypothetical protein